MNLVRNFEAYKKAKKIPHDEKKHRSDGFSFARKACRYSDYDIQAYATLVKQGDDRNLTDLSAIINDQDDCSLSTMKLPRQEARGFPGMEHRRSFLRPTRMQTNEFEEILSFTLPGSIRSSLGLVNHPWLMILEKLIACWEPWGCDCSRQLY